MKNVANATTDYLDVDTKELFIIYSKQKKIKKLGIF